VAAAIGIHIVATTSIKTNLGILLGALTAGAVHFGYVSRLLWRNALVILGAAGVLAFAVASNEAAVATIERGAHRVGLGIEILQARENLPGYSSFERRANWQREGFRGWVENPVFGHGVEAFRSGHGITSHASHVDIAYNSGLIGLVLFYSLFASMFQRLYRARHGELRNTRLLILGGVVCYFFISFAGTIHYSSFLAAFLALSIGILKRA
jgi:O-antigen ligase